MSIGRLLQDSLLLYGRAVWGSLDILKDAWVTNEKSDESVVSHILSVQENRYVTTSEREFCQEQISAEGLVWPCRIREDTPFSTWWPSTGTNIPTSTSKPSGKDHSKWPNNRNCELWSRHRDKKEEVNMLRRWHVLASPNYYSDEVVNKWSCGKIISKTRTSRSHYLMTNRWVQHKRSCVGRYSQTHTQKHGLNRVQDRH